MGLYYFDFTIMHTKRWQCTPLKAHQASEVNRKIISFLKRCASKWERREKKENSLGPLNLYIQISYKHIVLIFLWCLRGWNQQQLRSDSSSFGIKWKEEKSWQFLKNAFNDKIIWSRQSTFAFFFALSLSLDLTSSVLSRGFRGEAVFGFRGRRISAEATAPRASANKAKNCRDRN